MFLGIRYNVWHGILVQPVVAVVFVLVWYPLSGYVPAPWLFLLAWVLGMFVAHHLQSWNEARQAIDPKVEARYGSYPGFQDNSRDDWRWFWRGILVSWVLPILIIIQWG